MWKNFGWQTGSCLSLLVVFIYLGSGFSLRSTLSPTVSKRSDEWLNLHVGEGTGDQRSHAVPFLPRSNESRKWPMSPFRTICCRQSRRQDGRRFSVLLKQVGVDDRRANSILATDATSFKGNARRKYPLPHIVSYCSPLDPKNV